MQRVTRVAIVLVNWNGKADTIACLDSLMQLQDNDFSIVVADNASSDGSFAAIQAWSASQPQAIAQDFEEAFHPADTQTPLSHFLTFVHNGANLGFAAANNIGIRRALLSPDITHVWLLNNDTEVLPDTLAALRRRFAQDPTIGICGSTLVFHHDKQTLQAVGTRFYLASGYGQPLGLGSKLPNLPDRATIEAELTYIPGASMFVSRAFLETVGLMEESYFLYGEELNWSLRNNGRFRLAWAPDSIVYHKEGGSIGTSSHSRPSATSVYYQNRSILQVTRQFQPSALPKVLARILMRGARFLSQGDRENAAAVLHAVMDRNKTGKRK